MFLMRFDSEICDIFSQKLDSFFQKYGGLLCLTTAFELKAEHFLLMCLVLLDVIA